MRRVFSFYLGFVLAVMMLATPAHASGKRKVTKFEYDTAGRQIATKVYDDVGASAQLVLETETIYDEYSNVLQSIQKKVVGYDRLAQVNSYDWIRQIYEYEDTTWPTKVTRKYNPAYHTKPEYAERFFYDQNTGLLELSFSSDYYCTDPARSPGQRSPGSFTVEQSGASLTLEIRPYVYCGVNHAIYGSYGRPTENKNSHVLHYAKYNTTDLDEYVWIETNFEYFPDGSTQKGALKRAIIGGVGETVRMFTNFDWDGVGNLISTTNNGTTGSLGYTTSAEYDAFRRAIRTVDPEGGETQYAYDNAGRLRAMSNLLTAGNWGISRAEYFDDGQLKSITDPDGDIVNYTYDDAGRVDIVTDGAGRQTKTLYYPNGLTKCVLKAYGTSFQQAYSTYEYAADGQVIAQRPAKGSNPTTCAKLNDKYDTTYSYDEHRRLFETVYPKRADDAGASYVTDASFARGAGHTYTRQWLNKNNQPFQTRTRKGDIHNLYYKINKKFYYRNTSENRYYEYQFGSGYKYFAEVRPLVNGAYHTPRSTNLRRYAYYAPDRIGRPMHEQIREGYSDNLGVKAPYTYAYYDTAGNQDRMRYWSGAYTRYTYDKNDLLKTAWFSATSSSSNEKKVAHNYYDLAGRQTHKYLSDSNAVSSGGGPMHGLQVYYYDADRDLKQLLTKWTRTDPTILTLTGFYYRYDQDGSGKMTAAYSTGSTWRYTPPASKTEVYGGTNDLDQYGSVNLDDGAGTQVQAYDGAGNLILDGSGRTYTYNSENQMIRAQGPGLDMEYWYDGEGRRSHSIDHVAGTETFHKHFGQMEISDYEVVREGGAIPSLIPDANGNFTDPAKVLDYIPKSRVIIGQKVDERYAYHDVDGDDLTFYMTNHQGSTVAMVGEDGQLLTHASGGRLVYDPYGGNANNAPISGQPYRYTGRRLDAQTGLYYYRARYYDPKQGRFLQTDPIGYEDQMNLYGYVGNDPINFVDPSGLAKICQNTSEVTYKGQSTDPNGDVIDAFQISIDPSCWSDIADWFRKNGDYSQPPLEPLARVTVDADRELDIETIPSQATVYNCSGFSVTENLPQNVSDRSTNGDVMRIHGHLNGYDKNAGPGDGNIPRGGVYSMVVNENPGSPAFVITPPTTPGGNIGFLHASGSAIYLNDQKDAINPRKSGGGSGSYKKCPSEPTKYSSP